MSSLVASKSITPCYQVVEIWLDINSFVGRFGRRVAFSRTLFVSGVCLVCSLLVSNILTAAAQPDMALLAKVGFAVCGKCFITSAFAVAYFFGSELFPTEVR